MSDLCGVTLGVKDSTNVHSCYFHPHSPETKHECVCGKRWMSYANVTGQGKNSPRLTP